VGARRVIVSIVLAALVVVTILTVAARYGPAISRAVFSDSDEALLFGILAVLLLTAGATDALSVSAAVGAFLAGIVFSGPAADRARSLLVPLRSVFAGTFFLFFGFEVDPGTIPKALPAALGLAIVGAATKIATGWIGARRAGIGRRGRIRAGTALVARGEFSIVIAGIAVAADAEPDLGPLAACSSCCSRSADRSWPASPIGRRCALTAAPQRGPVAVVSSAGLVDRASRSMAVGRRSMRRSSIALIATMIVETLIASAPTAGGRITPAHANAPAASGMATTL
jgi:CPA2 family monovalent cation:H+ antiporter-2